MKRSAVKPPVPKTAKAGLSAFRWTVGFDEESGPLIAQLALSKKRKVSDVLRVIVEDHLRDLGMLKQTGDPLSAVRAARKEEPKK